MHPADTFVAAALVVLAFSTFVRLVLHRSDFEARGASVLAPLCVAAVALVRGADIDRLWRDGIDPLLLVVALLWVPAAFGFAFGFAHLRCRVDRKP